LRGKRGGVYESRRETGSVGEIDSRRGLIAKSLMTLAACTALLVSSPSAEANVIEGTPCAPAPTRQAPNETNVQYKLSAHERARMWWGVQP